MKSKKVIASAGVLALGVAGLRGINVSGLSPQETSKRWTVTASLGMFYDDNNLNSATAPQASLGVELNPRLSLNLPLDLTLMKGSYDLRLDYYAARKSNAIDQEHTLGLDLNHRFSERSTLTVENTFVSATQPEVTSGNNAQTTFQRGARGDFSHVRNLFNADYSLRLAPTYGGAFGFRNSTFNYLQTGDRSLSALLDRTENEIRLEGQLYPSTQTRLFAGYELGVVNYTGTGLLGFETNATSVLLTPIRPSARNTLSHYFYVGGERILSPRLSGEVRMGARDTDFYNQGLQDISPYLDLSATSYFLPGSTFTLGTKVDRNATDIGLGQNGLARDQLSGTMFIDVRHRFSRRATGTLSLRFQHSIYNGGDFDGQADDYVTIAPGFEYLVGENLYVVLGYTREDLLSSLPNRAFSKNRVMLSIRAAF